MLRKIRDLCLSRVCRFVADRSGQTAVTFGLTVIPLLLAVGCGVDYSRAVVVKGRLGEALDASALAVGGMAGLTDAQMTEMAEKYFYANYPGQELGTVMSLKVSRTGEKGNAISASGTARVSTTFMQLAGIPYVDVDVTVEVMRDAQSLEAVLVLDTTGSMEGAKLATLKTAAKDLITKLTTSSTVKIGIVPFAKYVNIGMQNRHIPGVSVPDDSNVCQMVDDEVETCTGTEEYQDTCYTETNPHQGTCYNDGAPYSCTVYDYISYACTRTRGTGCTTTIVQKQECEEQVWHGCVGSRPPPLNATDDNFETPLPGLMNKTCGQPLVQLTNQKAKLTALIDDLEADESTYIPAGLSVGWHVLSPGIPFVEGAATDANPAPRRALVLMTDGANTVEIDDQGPKHDETTDSGPADALTKQLCANIKDDGVEVFTVAFQINDTATKDMIRDCASDPANYFDASDPSKLVAAFENIATALSKLRLSR